MANIRIEGACTIVTANTDTAIQTVAGAESCSTLTDKGKVTTIIATNSGSIDAIAIVTWCPTGASPATKYRMYAKVPRYSSVAILAIDAPLYVTSADKFWAQSDKITVNFVLSGIGE